MLSKTDNMTTEYIIIINLEDLWLLIYILYAYVYIIYGLGWFIIYIPAESYRSGGESQCYISTSVQSVHTAPGLGRLSTAGLRRRYK